MDNAYSGLINSLGLTDNSTLAVASATVNGALSGNLIDTATATSLLTAIGTAQTLGETTVKGIDNVDAQKSALLMNSKYGYAMPLVSKVAKRKGIYSIHRYNITNNFYPYFVYEAADPGPNDAFPKGKIYMVGFNYKPVPVVTCKLEYSWVDLEETALKTGYSVSGLDAVGSTRSEDFEYLQMSVSYAF
jgi:hypothetical protein